MAATANIALVADDWVELASAAAGHTDILITFSAGRACQIAVSAAKPAASISGHTLEARSENNRFAAELSGTEKVWGRSYQTGVSLAVTR